jgi:hypothetical protein
MELPTLFSFAELLILEENAVANREAELAKTKAIFSAFPPVEADGPSTATTLAKQNPSQPKAKPLPSPAVSKNCKPQKRQREESHPPHPSKKFHVYAQTQAASPQPNTYSPYNQYPNSYCWSYPGLYNMPTYNYSYWSNNSGFPVKHY